MAPHVEFLGESFAPPLAPMRLAEPFERLRDASEAARETPRLFLAAIGSPAAHAPRAGFAREYFEMAGVVADADVGGVDAALSSERFRASGARFACLCGADADYAAHAEAFARALKRAGAEYVLLAGRPREREPALRAAGVDDFIHAGQDALAFLTSFLQRAGAPPRVASPGSPLSRG